MAFPIPDLHFDIATSATSGAAGHAITGGIVFGNKADSVGGFTMFEVLALSAGALAVFWIYKRGLK